MPSFYTGSSGSSARPTYKPASLDDLGFSSGSRQLDVPGDDGLDAGKFTVDLTDPAGSIGETIGSAVEFGGGLIGGVTGAIGSIGLDQDHDLGQLIEELGRIPGGVGDFELPYLGNDPTRAPAHLSDVPALVGDVVTAPGRFVEREMAKARVASPSFRQSFDPRQFLPAIGPLLVASDQGRARDLPADLQERLDNGESVDAIADELLARGQGFSSDPIGNVTGQIVLDPLNLIAPGGARALGAARAAGAEVRAVDDLSKLGIGTRAAGTMYNAAASGLGGAGAALTDKVLGHTTSGVLHALGTKPYQSIRSGLGKLDQEYAQRFEESFALGAAQMPRAVIGHYMADEAAAILRRGGDLPADVAKTVERRLETARTLAPDDLERRSQELLYRVAPTFDGVPADELAATTARKLAAIAGTSLEDAARVLGRVDRQTAQTVHLAYYGRAGADLSQARASIAAFDPRAKRIDASRLTLVADDTLTVERARGLLEPGADLAAAVERYPVLTNHFLGKSPDDATVREFVQRLVSQDALITTVKRPTTGANALPKGLGRWRAKYAGDYDLGFAPEGGWKVVTDADGVPVYADPFVHFVAEWEPVTARNPLGRFVDSLFRGTTQGTIVAESRQRFVDDIVSRGLPISPNQARAIHHAIIEEAASRGVTPRSLVADSTTVVQDGAARRVGLIDAIVQRFLTPAEYAAVKAEIDPTFLVMRAFQGNMGTVGLTQFITGGLKRLPGLGPMGAHVAERIYPQVRFALNPMFQLQELIESPFLNALRGVTTRTMDPDVAKVYGELVELQELRYLAESGYFLHLANGESVKRFLGVNSRVGRALGRFADVVGKKEQARVRQVLSEHGPAFRAAVQRINPRAWKAMEEAYGTTDPRIIADRFLAERFAIGVDEDIAGAMRAFDAAWKPTDSSATAETVWQAWRTVFEQQSRQAFATHFFRPQRGWLERSLNHPMLAVYPLSYMAKVAGEFSRFLLRRPFGLNAPLVGLVALERVQTAYLGAIADDPEFRQFLQDHPDATYLASALIPGDPTALGMGAPAWLRHVSEDAAAGKDITAETLGREAMDTAGYQFGAVRGPVTLVEGAVDLADIGADIFANLEQAARLYDGQVRGDG